MSSLIQALKNTAKRPLEWSAALAGPQARWRKPAEPALWVLMYHRILPADDPRAACEEPGMMVTPATFAAQLAQLQQLFTVVSLQQWVNDWQQGKPLPAKACAITFDDGWRDNYEFAFPLLKEANCPATIFLVADHIGTDKQFWPNRLASLLMKHPQSLQQQAWAWLRQLMPVLPAAIDTRDQMAAIINHCKSRTDQWLHQQLDHTEKQLGGTTSVPAMLDWQQVNEMQASGLIEFGSHTLSHQRLTDAVDPATLKAEIADSREQLTTRLQQPVQTFCYPNGDLCPAALAEVKANYQCAVTTRTGINRVGDFDPLQLQRIGVHEDISHTPVQFQARLANWR